MIGLSLFFVLAKRGQSEIPAIEGLSHQIIMRISLYLEDGLSDDYHV